VEKVIVLPAQSSDVPVLQAKGFEVTARSFGARLDAADVDREGLVRLAWRAGDETAVRELTVADVDSVLDLDAATLGDYPGGAATQHVPFDRDAATPTEARRAWGAVTPEGRLLALTFVDLDGPRAETDVTVVRRGHRGRGLGTAVKAASVLALADDGVSSFRMGGSAENAAIIRAGEALGYVRDEDWVTLERVPDDGLGRSRVQG
jgi:GNAT superfamily N-acetyltransferase